MLWHSYGKSFMGGHLKGLAHPISKTVGGNSDGMHSVVFVMLYTDHLYPKCGRVDEPRVSVVQQRVRGYPPR